MGNEIDLKENLYNGDVVFAKMVGYPWWPGVVESERSLPLDIREAKPDGEEEELFAVRFLGDKSYAWLPRSAITLFNPDHPKSASKAFKATKKTSKMRFLAGVKEALKLWTERRNSRGLLRSDSLHSPSLLTKRPQECSSRSENRHMDDKLNKVIRRRDADVKSLLITKKKDKRKPSFVPESRLSDELCSSLSPKSKCDDITRQTPSVIHGYSFRASPKISLRAAESGEVPGLRSIQRVHRKAIVEEVVSPEFRNSVKVGAQNLDVSGAAKVSKKRVSDIAECETADNAPRAKRRLVVEVTDEPIATKNELNIAEENKPVEEVTRANDLCSFQNCLFGVKAEISEISNVSDHQRKVSAPSVDFEEEEVVALSVLVNFRH
mmetsp:Transcript_11891/g.36250  ORF Transcript_11891/g.36250 Transcript_11891/m.36250 type:complete len:379 (+) Transcript_11891:244-1380(+)